MNTRYTPAACQAAQLVVKMAPPEGQKAAKGGIGVFQRLTYTMDIEHNTLDAITMKAGFGSGPIEGVLKRQ